MLSVIDHIVIAAPTLQAGIQYVQDKLGVMPVPGGSHEKMGTHNYLLRLGDAVYLEVIAVDPAKTASSRARWFGLDQMKPDAEPRFLTWVARTDDINAAKENAGIEIGFIENMSRNDLQWRIAIPPDGSLLYDGIAPCLIQWDGTDHPAQRLPDAGCSLLRIEAVHPEAVNIERYLNSVGFNDPFSVLPAGNTESISLISFIQTPAGICQIG